MRKGGGAPLEFWFDFASGYAYFAAMEIDALAARHGRTVVWRPLPLRAGLGREEIAWYHLVTSFRAVSRVMPARRAKSIAARVGMSAIVKRGAAMNSWSFSWASSQASWKRAR